jgi:hypothetical protein
MRLSFFGASLLSLIIVHAAAAQGSNPPTGATVLVVTASNTVNNELMIYNAAGTLLKSVPTRGQGGVGGNAGGIAQNQERLAVVNLNG